MEEKEQERQLSVLVVDDDPFMVKVMRTILKLEGFIATEALSGSEALKLVKDVSPDVVLLDIMMPPPDGLEVCRRMKEDPETRDIPVIFVTAKTNHKIVEEAMSLGAQGYITKPFDNRFLIEEIYRITGLEKHDTER